MIQDVAELRAFGQVCRHVAELDVDVDTWRAAMRRTARLEGMRIRTSVVEEAAAPAPAPGRGPGNHHVPLGGPPAGSVAAALVYAVRTDLPTDQAAIRAAVDQLPVPPGFRVTDPAQTPASVISLLDQRARRTGHPCTAPPPP